ncbi:MAG: hypothetical protein GY796_30770, partial [Chloroflexi bacterium]|nr:hypothetical protein [Chloroflexota bacterium]
GPGGELEEFTITPQPPLFTKERGPGGELEEFTITSDDYETVGGLKHALSNHADEAFEELDAKQQKIAEIMFRRLSERGAAQRDTRNPTPLSEIAAVAGVTVPEVSPVVEVFRHPERCFLTPAHSVQLEPDTVLDISHESLIRQWQRMNAWVEQEAKSAETYQRLEKTAYLWKEGNAGLWGTPDLEITLAWKEQETPTPEWAGRYSATSPPTPLLQGEGSNTPPSLAGQCC